MATKKTSSATYSSTPMQITSGELFGFLSQGKYSGVGGSVSSAKSSGTKQSGGGGGGYIGFSSGPAAPVVDQTARFTDLYKEMVKTTFPESGVAYTPVSETDISGQIAAWLLPGYERAITDRKELTRGYAAELDADAIARGMGASTYVTDVKSRQQRDEAKDIATLMGEYGATLAKNVAERLSEEKDRALQADMFNAEAKQEAYKMAYEAAVFLMGLGAVAHETEEEETA